VEPRYKKIKPDLASIVRDLTVDSIDGRPLTVLDRTHALRELAGAGVVPTLEPMLPLILSLNQKPYSLADYKPFSQLFRVRIPRNMVLMTGRQLGKSTVLAALGITLANAVPGFKQLYVTPLYEQIRRFSNNYVRPFINFSPIKSRWTGTTTENSVLQRSFKNQSLMIFSFALLDADRVRGVSAHAYTVDEVQDIDPDHLPVIKETVSASIDWGIGRFAGTSKTTDSPLNGLWNHSSQAEWFIPCFQPGCGTWNIPSKEYHILDMIGPMRDDITTRNPGVVCHKCRKPIHPDAGHWVHRYREKRWHMAGYHIPQIIVPLHYGHAHKWHEILLKQQGWGNTRPAAFWNEVLGEPFDEGQKIITETELRAAANLGWKNNTHTPDPKIFERLKYYKHRLMSIDWGGGGEKGISYTAISILGYKEDGGIDCLWGKKLLLGSDHLAEAKECLRWFKRFQCDFVSHDFTGAGEVRETVMMQAGFDPSRIFAIRLVRAGFQNMIVYHGPTPLNHHKYYSLDKTRSLLYTCNTIRLGKLKFFNWDKESDANAGLLADFLALVENKAETHQGGDVYTIRRNVMFPDDFAQSVNMGCAALWHVNNAWPDFAKLAKVARITNSTLRTAGNAQYGWEQEGRGFLGLP
jgi:hypothetical protein